MPIYPVTVIDRAPSFQTSLPHDLTMAAHAMMEKETLGRRSTEEQLTEDPERLLARRRSFHSKVLIGGLIVTVVLGLALGLGLGLTIGSYGRS